MKESVTWRRDQGQFILPLEEDFIMTDNTLIVSERMKYTQQVKYGHVQKSKQIRDRNQKIWI